MEDFARQWVLFVLEMEERMIEQLASLVHEMWCYWMKHLVGQVEWRKGVGWVIPEQVVGRWQRQMGIPYEGLSEKEKESDREMARKVLKAVEGHFARVGKGEE